MMSNQSQILVYDFKKHTPLITDYILLPVHTVVLVLIIWISFKVQTAVFKILERLGTRHINTIIKTNMVCNPNILNVPLVFICCYVFFKIEIVTQCKDIVLQRYDLETVLYFQTKSFHNGVKAF